MSKRKWRLFAEDIMESVTLIDRYIKDMDARGFEDDKKTQDAVVRNLEIIGEGAKYIPDEIKNRYSEVDWKGIIGLRNRVVHEYFGISLSIVWTIIKQEIPAIRKQMERILKDEP